VNLLTSKFVIFKVSMYGEEDPLADLLRSWGYDSFVICKFIGKCITTTCFQAMILLISFTELHSNN